MRCKWIYDVDVDESLPDVHGSASQRRWAAEAQPTGPRKKVPSVSEQQRAEAGWQAAYEARKRAEMRLGLRAPTANDDGDDEFTREWGATTLRRAAEVRRIEDQRDPRAELIAAARGGDRAAIRRCDGLFENWQDASGSNQRCVAG